MRFVDFTVFHSVSSIYIFPAKRALGLCIRDLASCLDSRTQGLDCRAQGPIPRPWGPGPQAQAGPASTTQAKVELGNTAFRSPSLGSDPKLWVPGPGLGPEHLWKSIWTPGLGSDPFLIFREKQP